MATFSEGPPKRYLEEWNELSQHCASRGFRDALYHSLLLKVVDYKAVSRAYSIRRRKENPELFREKARILARARRRDGRDAIYAKKRRQDPAFRLQWINRSRINSALKRQSASKMVRSIMGCTAQELKAHIESKFKPGMTWENQGKVPGTWQIDHIRPLASYDLTDKAQQAEAFHFSNMQPLWFHENNEKHSFWNGRTWKHSDHRRAA